MDTTVPILIDDVKKYPRFAMSRCTYFSIEACDPAPNWFLGLEGDNMPFYLTGLNGVITSYNSNLEEFNSSSLIEDVFNRIDQTENLIIDINDIWMPNSMLNKLEIGNVYRVSIPLFTLALYFRNGEISKDQFEELSKGMSNQVRFSSEETHAFSRWSENQIDQAREYYENNQERALKYDDERGENV